MSLEACVFARHQRQFLAFDKNLSRKTVGHAEINYTFNKIIGLIVLQPFDSFFQRTGQNGITSGVFYLTKYHNRIVFQSSNSSGSTVL